MAHWVALGVGPWFYKERVVSTEFYYYGQPSRLPELSIALANMQGQYAQKIPTQMAASVLAMAPMLLVFLIGQKQMLEGIALSSIKA